MAVNMKRCEKCGSFFNASKDANCPYCSGNSNDIGATMPMFSATAPMDDYDRTVAMREDVDDADGRTVPLIKKTAGFDPVVGWLVCIAGAEKGRDYKIHSENNSIGRSEHMDICIHGDDTISRENHAIVSYDDRERIFYFTPGDGRAMARLNGKAVMMTTELQPYDQIEIGTTILTFVPLCGPTFSWG